MTGRELTRQVLFQHLAVVTFSTKGLSDYRAYFRQIRTRESSLDAASWACHQRSVSRASSPPLLYSTMGEILKTGNSYIILALCDNWLKWHTPVFRPQITTDLCESYADRFGDMRSWPWSTSIQRHCVTAHCNHNTSGWNVCFRLKIHQKKTRRDYEEAASSSRTQFFDLQWALSVADECLVSLKERLALILWHSSTLNAQFHDIDTLRCGSLRINARGTTYQIKCKIIL